MTLDIIIRADENPTAAARLAKRLVRFIDSAAVKQLLGASRVRIYEYDEDGTHPRITRRP